MEQEFVIYDQVLALKELGFDEPCMGVYYGDVEDIQFTLNVRETQYYAQKGYKNGVLAPLYQQAFRWFRDNHQLFYTIETNCSQLSFEWGFDYTIYDKGNDKWLSTEPQNCPPGETTYVTYEEAESACIDKLIEIVKNR